jgi:alpha-L-fucosidase
MLLNDWTYVSREYADDWLARSAEIVQKYQPEVMYFDWWIGQPSFRANVTRFTAFYYNFAARNNIPAVINIRDYAIDWRAGARDFERGIPESIEPDHWQTATSISNISWGYVEHDQFKSPEFIVHQLIDIVSKNGNLLLNVGPRPDGTLPDEVRAALLDIGAWLQQNGEAIYDTTPWRVYGEGPTRTIPGFRHDQDTQPYTPEDFRFTRKGDTVYAIAMARPADGRFVIRALGSAREARDLRIGDVELLGSSAKLAWRQTRDALEISAPPDLARQHAYAFRIRRASSALDRGDSQELELRGLRAADRGAEARAQLGEDALADRPQHALHVVPAVDAAR